VTSEGAPSRRFNRAMSSAATPRSSSSPGTVWVKESVQSEKQGKAGGRRLARQMVTLKALNLSSIVVRVVRSAAIAGVCAQRDSLTRALPACCVQPGVEHFLAE
jgi:hypothetical protein